MNRINGEKDEGQDANQIERKKVRVNINTQQRENSYLLNSNELKDTFNKKEIELHLLRDPV